MRCNICYLPINEVTSREACPRCFNDFHRDHLAAWLLKRDYCPMCRDTLSEAFIASFKPKDEQERLRLEAVLRTLDSLGETFRDLETRERKQIMRARETEFGLEGGGIGSLIKMLFPVILIGMSLFVVILALTT